MQVTPYLFFDGRCDEALTFYKKALGAEVGMLMRFKDNPDKNSCAPGSEDKVMHATLRVGNTTLMASDGHAKGAPKFDGFALSLDAKDEADAKRLFDAVADGGEVMMPLGPTFFAKTFGMTKDRFGIVWMVLAEK